MRKRVVLGVVLGLAIAAAGTAWELLLQGRRSREILLHGNVDLRQVELAFDETERIASVLVQEGDRVRSGQVLAKLDTRRIEPQVARAEALVAALAQAVGRLHAGSRPEEIAQAQANLESAKADAAYARRQYDRLRSLSRGAVSVQDLESAKAASDVAEARLIVSQKVLDLAVLGPRLEDIAEAEARLRSEQAQLALLERQLADAELLAPHDAVVRSRLMEPGEIASPSRPVLSLAITDPKWVRAYAAETVLGRIRPGEAVLVFVDSFPDRSFSGWIGFISPVAEFTPKAVEVEELRTSLVYEVRVFVKDPQDELRLGMPATLRLRPVTAASSVAPIATLSAPEVIR